MKHAKAPTPEAREQLAYLLQRAMDAHITGIGILAAEFVCPAQDAVFLKAFMGQLQTSIITQRIMMGIRDEATAEDQAGSYADS